MSAPALGDLAEFLNVVVETQGRLDTTWMLFLSINSTIIGAIIIIKRKFNIFEKVATISVYTALVSLNLLVMNNIVKQLHAFYKDLASITYTPDHVGYNIVQHFSHFSGDGRFWANEYFIPIIYACFYGFTISCIIYDEKFTITEKSKT